MNNNSPLTFIKSQLQSNYSWNIILGILFSIIGYIHPIFAIIGGIVAIYLLVNAYSIKNQLMLLQLGHQSNDDPKTDVYLSHARGLMKIWWWSFGISIVFSMLFLNAPGALLISALIIDITFVFIYLEKEKSLKTDTPFSLNDAMFIKAKYPSGNIQNS